MENEPGLQEKQSLVTRWRKVVFPIKETDHPFVKFSKNIGFITFMVLLICVSLGILAGVALAL